MDYIGKALKYKLKYFRLLKKMNGGLIDWYPAFESELFSTYRAVKEYTANLVLTGSSAIAYVLNYLKMYDELNMLEPAPRDFDFVFEASQIPNLGKINDDTTVFKRQSEYQITKGCEYKDINNQKRPFELIFERNTTLRPRVRSVNINGIDIINLQVLRGFYDDNFDSPKNLNRKNLLDKIILKIESDEILRQKFKFSTNKRKICEDKIINKENEDANINYSCITKKLF